MIEPENAYDHLIPKINAIESTVRLHLMIGQFLPEEMHKLLLHVITQAEQIGLDRGRAERRIGR